MNKMLTLMLLATMLALAAPVALAGTMDTCGDTYIAEMSDVGQAVAVEDCTADIENTWTVDATAAPPDMVETTICEKKAYTASSDSTAATSNEDGEILAMKNSASEDTENTATHESVAATTEANAALAEVIDPAPSWRDVTTIAGSDAVPYAMLC